MKASNYKTDEFCLSYYIGSLLREQRVITGLSGRELSYLLDISQQQISRYERGLSNLQLSMLFKFFFALDMDKNAIELFFDKITYQAYMQLGKIDLYLDMDNKNHNNRYI